MDSLKKDLASENINSMTEEELKELRRFLFEERIALINERRAQEEFYEKVLNERISFREEMKQLNSKVLLERKRLKEEQSFFDKKMTILQTGFANLEMDRKAFNKEKERFEHEKSLVTVNTETAGSTFFAGVSSYLGLRKRYRELLRIYHPDNMDGDNNISLLIKEEYEKLKEKF